MATILVVDDEVALVTLLATLLREEGYTVLTASNGHAALRMLRTIHPDGIITDVMMPGMTGTELWTRVRANPETAAIPMVFWTAAVSSAVQAACPRAVVLTKPCDWDILLDQVGAMVQAGGEAA